LYVANYVRYRSLKDDLPCMVRGGRRSYCIPVAYAGDTGRLFRNLGNGRFADVTRSVGLEDAKQKGLGVLATDLNDDGWPDLLAANDTVPNRLFLNRHGRFEEQADVAGIAFGPSGQPRAGMGVDAGDWQNRGGQTVAITNFLNESIGFYVPLAPGQASFTDA